MEADISSHDTPLGMLNHTCKHTTSDVLRLHNNTLVSFSPARTNKSTQQGHRMLNLFQHALITIMLTLAASSPTIYQRSTGCKNHGVPGGVYTCPRAPFLDKEDGIKCVWYPPNKCIVINTNLMPSI